MKATGSGKNSILRIYILSNSRTLYSTRRLFEEARIRQHEPRVYPPMHLSISLDKSSQGIFFQGLPLKMPNSLIPRIGQKKSDFSMSVVRHFELHGVHSLNKSQAIDYSRDKFRTLQILNQRGISIPKTFFLDSLADIQLALDYVQSPPVIIKLSEGSQGRGVMLAESNRSARSMIENLLFQGQSVLVQEFVKESKGSDTRIIILGENTIAAMKRSSLGDEFRSNVHLGARTEKINLSIEADKMARSAMKSLGLSFAGVDIIDSKRGPLLLEVNSSPGFEGIETTTGVNIAKLVIQNIEKMHQKKPFSSSKIV